MSIATLITMVLVVAILWGGFAMVLALALSKERQKRHQEKGRQLE